MKRSHFLVLATTVALAAGTGQAAAGSKRAPSAPSANAAARIAALDLDD